MITPDFPDWTGGFARHLQKLRSTAAPTLHQFELLFAAWVPHWRLAQQDDGSHSRHRRWNLRLVFWTFLWQVAQAGTSCREAIRQAQGVCRLAARTIPPDQSSPYCQSRGNIPLEVLQEIYDAVVNDAEEVVAQNDRWCGHRVLAVD